MFYLGKRVEREPFIEVCSPYDGHVVGRVSETVAEDMGGIISAAQRGADIMRKMPAGERAEILEKAAAMLYGNKELATLLSLEVGKTIREAQGEINRAANTLKLSSIAAREITGETVRFDLLESSNKIGYYTRVPVGIVLCITPFNFPMNLACHKIGPAIAAGNAVIVKPATKTPLTTMKLAEILIECGLPPEALTVTVMPGGPVSDALVAHPAVRKVSFTGSVAIGTHITKTSGLKKITMELGSNSAVVVMPDAELSSVAKKVCAGAFACAGQVCISVQRVFVQQSVYDAFLAMLASEAAKLHPGDPLDEACNLGVMISEKEAARAVSWVKEAVAAGARLVLGGERDAARMSATILGDAPVDCRLMQDEVFAPVVAVNRFETLEEAIGMVNNSPYGLQNSIFTNNLSDAMLFVDGVDSGSVLVNESPNFRVDNMPYGGFKQSGLGKEAPAFTIEEMTEMKLVIIDRA